MARTTINKVNARINQYGYELVRGKGYYYFSPITDDAVSLDEEGIYGSMQLGAWTVDQLEKELLERIERNKPEEGGNPFILRVHDHLKT
jgi:hypothetical protein